MSTRRSTVIAGGLLALVFTGATAMPADALSAAPGAPVAKRYANCTALNKVYPSGVGLPKAKDKVSGRTKPVTTFTRNAKVYNLNASKLDRDNDGIACERHVKAPAKKAPAKKAPAKKAVATKR